MIINETSDVIALINIGLAVIIVLWDAYFYWKVDEAAKWTKLFYIIVAALWILRYLLFFFGPPYFQSDDFNDLYVRSLVSLTLSALAVGSIIRVRRVASWRIFKADMLCTYRKLKRKLWIFNKR